LADETLYSFDASDDVATNNARREAERIARQDADVIRAIMHTKLGRAWMIRQLERCYVNSEQKFVLGSPDGTAHNLGRESYGLELLKDVQRASVDLYMTAIREREAEEQRKAQVARDARKKREEGDRPVTAEDFVSTLPPPKGYPGHVPPPDASKQK
jgi:hypothetical protein